MKFVLSASIMDLLHRGHLNVLRNMREEAGIDGITVMFLHDDKCSYDTKGKIPIHNFEQRKKNIEMTGLVDIIIEVSDYQSLADAIFKFKNRFHKYEFLWLRGDEWQTFPARKTIEVIGIPIKLIPYTKGVSSTDIRNKL